MALAHSKLTAQGQISVPMDIRRKLGIGPSSILEWDEEGDKIVVRRSARFSSEDIHRAMFPGKAPKSGIVEDMKDGIRLRVLARYACPCQGRGDPKVVAPRSRTARGLYC